MRRSFGAAVAVAMSVVRPTRCRHWCRLGVWAGFASVGGGPRASRGLAHHRFDVIVGGQGAGCLLASLALLVASVVLFVGFAMGFAMVLVGGRSISCVLGPCRFSEEVRCGFGDFSL